MKFSCPECEAQYRVGDEYADKIVKIGCKKCGAKIVVEGGQVYARPPLTGQRSDTSVLFTLETIAAPTEEPSGLIDMRALARSLETTKPKPAPSHVDEIIHLGGGGAFAPALVTPDRETPTTFIAPEREKKRNLAPVAIAIASFAIACALVFAMTKKHSRPDLVGETVHAPVSEPVVIAATPSEEKTVVKTEAPTIDTPKVEAPKIATPKIDAPKIVTPKLESKQETKRCCPGESETACNIRVAAGGSCVARGFDRDAASRAISDVKLATCKKDGPGSSHVKITFETNGTVSSAVVDTPPFANTQTGACVEQRYRAVKIPPFDVGPIIVGKTFTIQ